MSEAHQFHSTVLREYDIRGIVGKTLTAADAQPSGAASVPWWFAAAVSGYASAMTAVSARWSWKRLWSKDWFRPGCTLSESAWGRRACCTSRCATANASAGVMITGSHNPPDYNGFKMMLGKAPVYGPAILELGEIASKGAYAVGDGTSEKIDIQDVYVERLLKDYDGGKELTVAWDAGNGAAGEILKRLTAKLPGKHILLYEDIDGTFPNHHPDPTMPENLAIFRRSSPRTNAISASPSTATATGSAPWMPAGGIVWGDQLVAIYASRSAEDPSRRHHHRRRQGQPDPVR